MIQTAFNDDFYKGDSNVWDSVKDREIEELLDEDDELDEILKGFDNEEFDSETTSKTRQ